MTGAAPEEFRGTERFSILRRLGKGGFGVVYEAYDRRRNSRVALKVLRRLDAAALYRFKQEFRSLTDVSHPNLVSLYELLTESDEWFFTMELIDGVGLLEYLRAERASPQAEEEVTRSVADTRQAVEGRATGPGAPVSPPSNVDQVREVFAHLAEGVCALHEAGVLHRDIKPSNVMVSRQGRVVLLDFGLAAELAPGLPADSGSIIGTPAYMAPEQSAGLAGSGASDWYSVGTMLYQALTGRLPFTGSVLEILRDKQRREPPPPTQLVSGLPADLSALCQDLLRRDPGQRPLGLDVMRRLGVTGPLPAQSRPAPLIGRERHLAALLEAYWTTGQGRAVVVYVQGRSGMGKTALVRRFVDELRSREPEAIVLLGRCFERESVPYKALDSLVDALTQSLKRLSGPEMEGLLPADIRALTRLFPVLGELEEVAGAAKAVLEIPDSQQLRRRAFAALRELLARLAARAPLVLSIDDLQWGDLDSGALLEELLRPPDPPPLLLVACYRSEDAESSLVLRRLRAGLTVETRSLEVVELAPEEAQEMALALLGSAGERADAIALESGGSPLFLQELARFQGTPAGALLTLDEALHRRIGQLPEAARRFLEALSVAGQPVEVEVVKQSAGLVEDEYTAVAQLRAGRLVRSGGNAGEMETYHDRIRETVVAHLSVEALREQHRRLAAAWEASGRADPEVLATHFHGAGERDKAAHYAVLAADRAAAALAFDRAARLYRMALELADDRRLQPKLAEALANAGRGRDAARAYLTAAEGAPSGEVLEWSRRAAEQFLISGHFDDGMVALRSVLLMVGMKLPATPRRALVWLLLWRAVLWLRGIRFRHRDASELPAEQLLRIDTCWSVSVGLALVDFIRGSEFQARHLLAALRAGEPYRLARALALEVGYSAVAGSRGWHRTEKLLAATTALAEQVGRPHALGLAAFTAGAAAQCNGRFRQARELCDRAESILRERCTGVAWEIDSATIFGVTATSWMGDWNELERRLSVLMKDADERGDLYAAAFWNLRQAYILHLRADQPERAREEQHRSMTLWTGRGYHLQHYYHMYSLADIDLYRGEASEAWQRCSEQAGPLGRSLILRLQLLRIEWIHLQGRLALALGLRDEAERAARRLEGEGAPQSPGLAGLLRAALATARGRQEAAITLWAAAENACQDAAMAHYAVAARRRRGELVGGDEGRALMQAADDWMRSQKVRNPSRMTTMLAPVQAQPA